MSITIVSPKWLIESDGSRWMEDNVDVLLESGTVLVTDAEIVLHDVSVDKVNLVHEVWLCCPQLVI